VITVQRGFRTASEKEPASKKLNL